MGRVAVQGEAGRLVGHHLTRARVADAQRAGDARQQVVVAGGAHRVVEGECLQRDHAPGRDSLAAHVVAIGGRLLEHQHRVSGARQRRRQGAAAADDDVEAFVPAAPIRRGGRRRQP
ncbi:hypothetical protein KF840_08835 [bacterium]|nr:hypothetical protein [bacterium]